MNDRLGSHWRWRVAMLLIAAMLISYGWWQADRWTERVLVKNGWLPAVFRVVHRDRSQSIEAFDWKTGRRWKITDIESQYFSSESEDSVQVLANGEYVVWQNHSNFHAVDVMPHHQWRTFTIPVRSHEFGLAGFSSDARYVVFQARVKDRVLPDGKVVITPIGFWEPSTVPAFVLEVVDLRTGEIVSSRRWESTMMRDSRSEFLSYLHVTSPKDPTEPRVGFWKLTDDGQWELIEKLLSWDYQYVQMVRDPSGAWRLVEDLTLLSSENSAQGSILKLDSGKRFVAFEGSRRVFVGDFESKQVVLLDLDMGAITDYSIDEHGETLAVSDVRDDIVVFDLKTGKVIGRESSGSIRKNQLLMVGVALLALAMAWTRTAMKETLASWGVLDALAVSLLIQAAVFPFYASFDAPSAPPNAVIDVVRGVREFFLRGGIASAIVLVGWYWAHGRQWFPMRWLAGTIWLAASTIPLVTRETRDSYEDYAMILRAWVIVGMVMSGLIAAIAVVFRALGWSVRAQTEHPVAWRFGLMELFALTASVAIALVLIQSVLELPWIFARVEIRKMPVGAFLFGVPLVGLLFIKWRWPIVIGAAAFLIAAIAGTHAGIPFMGISPFSNPIERYVGEVIALTTSTLSILVPCLVLRSHGWRWTRLQSALELSEAVV